MRNGPLFDDDNFQLLCYCNLSCLVHGNSCAKFILGFGDNINNASNLVVAQVTMMANVSTNISTSLMTRRLLRIIILPYFLYEASLSLTNLRIHTQVNTGT